MLKLNPSKRLHPPVIGLFFEHVGKPSQHSERFKFGGKSDADGGRVVRLDVAGIR